MSGAKKKPGDSPKSNKAGPSGMDKKSLFSIQNFVRDPSNGVPRLQTFRPPRDLSLGGTKPKKIFTPNLNVARNKNKPKEYILEYALMSSLLDVVTILEIRRARRLRNLYEIMNRKPAQSQNLVKNSYKLKECFLQAQVIFDQLLVLDLAVSMPRKMKI